MKQRWVGVGGWAGWAWAVSVLTACTPANDDAWFPLQAGHTQRYGVTLTQDGQTSHQVWTETVGEARVWRDERVWPRRHSEGVTFLLREDARGIQRVATQADIDRQAQADEEPRWVLKKPYRVGTEWRSLGVPYLLLRQNEYPRELKHTHRVSMQWQIVSTQDQVQVPAGRFSPCLRVQGEGMLRLYVDPVHGFQDVPLQSTEWYCRGQGLVKWVRRERVQTGFFSGGEVQAELL